MSEGSPEGKDTARLYLDIAGTMIVALDSDGRVSLINKEACRILGCDESETIGADWFDRFIPERSRDGVRAEFARLMESGVGGVYRFENPVGARGGEERTIAWTNTVLQDEEGSNAGTLSLGEDITERREAEREREAALDEARRRQGEVSALLDGARAVLRYRDFVDAAGAIFDACKRLTGAAVGYIALLSADGSENEVVFLDAGGLSCSVDESLPMPIRGLRAEAYHTGRVVYDNDFLESEYMRFMPAGHAPLNSVMFAPLNIGGQALGLMGLANKPNGFTDNDARFAAAFGELAAIALNNSRTLEALEESEQRFRTVTETATDAIVCANERDEVVLWNSAAESIFGYAAEEIVGRSLTTIVPESRVEAHKEGLKRALTSGESRIIGTTIECVGLRKDGAEFPLELSLAEGRVGGRMVFTGIVRDITARKEVEAELKWLASFPGRNPTPVLETDYQGTVTFINPAGSREFPGIEMHGAEHPVIEVALRCFESFAGAGRDSGTSQVEVSGRFYHVSVWRVEDQERIRVYAIDQTERKRTEDQVRSLAAGLERRVEGRTAELTAANLRLLREIGERKKAEDTLISSRDRLRTLAAELSLAEERERRRIAGYLHDSIVQTLGLLKNRLTQKAKEAWGPDGEPPEDIRALVDEAIRDARSLTFELSPPILYELGLEPAVEWLGEQIQERYGIRTTTRDDGQPKPLHDDVRVLLFQAVRELLVNAAKHSGADSVEISMRRDGPLMLISTQDDGAGFNEAELESSPTESGHFGLFSIRERLDHIGGRLSVSSDEGKGTRFTLEVPLLKEGESPSGGGVR